MKKIILCFVMLLLSCSLFAESLFRVELNEYEVKDLNNKAQEILKTKEFKKEYFKTIDQLSFYGYSNFAYDICDKINSLTIDEEYLKFIKIHQSVALVRILVENGVIESINQIPEESVGVFNHKKDFLIKYYKKDLSDTEIQKMKELLEEKDISIEKFEEIIKNAPLMTAEKLSFEHSKLLAQVATIALVDKYPIASEKLFNDYLIKYGLDILAEIIINYLVDINQCEKAILLSDIAIREAEKIDMSEQSRNLIAIHHYKILRAFAYAKRGNLDEALGTINAFIENIDEQDRKDTANFIDPDRMDRRIEYYINKTLFYKYAGAEDKYNEEIEKTKKIIDSILKEHPIHSANNPDNPLKYFDDKLKEPHKIETIFMYSYPALSEGDEAEYTFITLENFQRNILL